MDSDYFFFGMIGFLMGVLVIGLILGLMLVDPSSINKLGNSMCEEHGLIFDEYELDSEVGIKFYCKNESVSVEDGYLLMTK